MQFCNKLLRLRQCYGLSQKQVGPKVNLSQQAYGKIERGKTRIDHERAKQFAGIFGVNVHDLCNDDLQMLIVCTDKGIRIFFIPETAPSAPSADAVLLTELEKAEKILAGIKQMLAPKE